MAKPVVRIENPLRGGHDFTSLNRARRFEKQGRAIFVTCSVIRFLALSEIDKPSAAAAAKSTEIAARHAVRKATESSYDKHSARGVICQREAKRIPFAGDVGRMGLSW